jgi:hypothetical protein
MQNVSVITIRPIMQPQIDEIQYAIPLVLQIIQCEKRMCGVISLELNTSGFRMKLNAW